LSVRDAGSAQRQVDQIGTGQPLGMPVSVWLRDSH
jgi:hypothetical protein